MTAEQPTVVVFLMTDLKGNDGAAAWARNLLSELRKITGIRFVVVMSAPPSVTTANEIIVKGESFDYFSIPWRDEVPPSDAGTMFCRIRSAIHQSCYHVGEKSIKMREYVDKELGVILESIRPDLLMINDIWSAFHLPSVFSVEQKKCLIMLNDEVAFHEELLSYLSPELGLYGSMKWIAHYRFRKKVEEIVRRCHATIVLASNDIPRTRPERQLTAILPPLLSERVESWTYSSNRSLLFVGHIGHFANRYAIEWICTKFMPAMRSQDSTIRMFIIGAADHSVPVHWQMENVEFLGDVGRDGIVQHLLNDDLFIAPIRNPYGAKLKVAECAAYGMPFVATEAAMSGLPFLERVPRVELEAPLTAAEIVKRCIDRGEMLMDLSAYIRVEMRRARWEQSRQWSDFVWTATGLGGA